jgi:putative ABC transport system permease protein
MTLPWSLRMAWRDTRGSRLRLLLFLLSMAVGVAALVAITSFGSSLRGALEGEALTLLGADLSLESNTPFSDRMDAVTDSVATESAERLAFTSMVFFPAQQEARLTLVRAERGRYPFYGSLETEPADALDRAREQGGALADAGLLDGFGVALGDSLQVGENRYPVVGRVLSSGRETGFASLVSPRVYIPLDGLDTTLTAQGARLDYERFVLLKPGLDPDSLVADLQPLLRAERVRADTPSEVLGDWQEGLDLLYRFLGLTAFIAVLLGGLGVAGATHVFIQSRLRSVAVLRCLGAPLPTTVAVHLWQAAGMGLIAGAIGTLVGALIVGVLPGALESFLPFEIEASLSWGAVGIGMAVGLLVTVGFALVPVMGVRLVSPLQALRVTTTDTRDPLRWLVGVVGVGVLVGFAFFLTGDWRVALGYAFGLVVVFGGLGLAAWALARGARALSRRPLPFTMRHGLASLHRPRNQTLLLLTALGFGTFLLLVLVIVQNTLIGQFDIGGGPDDPNLVLFDVQPYQADSVEVLLDQSGLPLLDRVPIVSMRLARVGDLDVEAARMDTARNDAITWAHRREYRSTYRDALTPTEELVEGTFTAQADPSDPAPPVSIEADVATELGVALGDTLVWDVGGRQVATTVGSVRQVDWQQFATNFFVVFPEGLLERAPQSIVFLTRVESSTQTAQLQADLARSQPNVSVVDLDLIAGVFQALFERIGSVIRFMALFSLVTGLIVLVAVVVSTRSQRERESVLMKTLGARLQQVRKLAVVEYALTGLLGGMVGTLFAVAAGWAVARWVFEVPLGLPWLAVLGTLLGVVALTLVVGLLSGRGTYARPTIGVLRAEG